MNRQNALKRNLAAVILAAGFGRRMAALGDKPLLRYEGKTFVEMIVAKLIEADINPIIIVTNSKLKQKVALLNLPVLVSINPQPEQGMLSSLLCGLKKVPMHSTGILLNPVDFPLVAISTYREMKHLHELSPGRIIKPVYEGTSGHPVIFPQNLFLALENAPLEEGARYVVRGSSHLVKILETDDPGILRNINTPEMYEKWCVK